MSRFIRTTISLGAALFLCTSVSKAEIEMGLFNPYVTTGPRTSPETLAPTLRKWYLPQTLYYLYGWKGSEYTTYAKDIYQRYVDIMLEGGRFYDIYGNYITKGWKIYDWTQEYPRDFGSGIFKHPYFEKWFGRVVVSSSSKGQFHTALTVGEAIRTTLTPLTFSKPLFDGLQWDFLADKYGFTMLASRADSPAKVAIAADQGATSLTTFTNLLGFRGIVQVGDFVKTGITYVNAGYQNSAISIDDNSLKGTLGGRLNADNIKKVLVRLSDDSPEDGVGGALLYRERIFIDGVEHPEIVQKRLFEGGVWRRGLLEASGGDVVMLTYDIEHDFRPGVEDKITDFKEIRKVEVGLVLANDYRVEMASNMQTNSSGQPAFLLVTRADGNIRDGSNQKYIRFQYGLPTGNEVAGVTFEVSDLAGFNFKGEYVINRRFRRFPNQNIRTNQALATDRSRAFYVAASQRIYPWFAYGEVFSIDPDYSTSMFIPEGGVVDYENKRGYLYEFVDDNDDQDQYPDWRRRYTGPYSGEIPDREVFPGLDENNDLISDFNQNNNIQPDYTEPFLRYDVDPPEFLFGTDMNNNTVIDRFENDTEPDYPYKRDHQGYNLYTGVELFPGSRLMAGYLREDLIASNRRNESVYGLLTLRKDFPRQNLSLQFMGFTKNVRDNIPDDLIQWVQPPYSGGMLQDFSDPLIAQNTFVSTIYLKADYTKFLPFTNKFKYELYHQKGSQAKGKRDEKFLGIINKADYEIPLRKDLTLWPKWKQVYKYVNPTERWKLKTKELSEIFFLLITYRFSKQLRINSGVEYEIFNNLLKKPEPPPSEFVEDFRKWTLASQFSNSCAYMGYVLTSNLGVRWNRRSFEGRTEPPGTTAFVTVYVGPE
jgi:hypothetical protein